VACSKAKIPKKEPAQNSLFAFWELASPLRRSSTARVRVVKVAIPPRLVHR
jgi:hypothetical protein